MAGLARSVSGSQHPDITLNDEAQRPVRRSYDRAPESEHLAVPQIIDLEPLERGSSPIPAARPQSYQAGDDWDAPIERIHKRRRLRPELLAFVAAFAIVGTAVVGQLTAPPPQPTPVPVVLVPVPTPNASNGRVAKVSNDPFAWYRQLWEAVDWSGLTVPDRHQSWGIATASISLRPVITGPASVKAPDIGWLPIKPSGQEATVSFPQGRRVFAFALTWPQGVTVTGLNIEYIGSPGGMPYDASAGIRPFAQVVPLPATVVVPNPTFGGPPDVRLLPAGTPAGGIPSGTFWVPPTQVSPLNSAESAALDWHALPWPWPPGLYRVQVDTARGALAMLLTLQESA